MNSEKLHAFYESWAAMWTHAWRAQLQTQRAVAAALAASASGKTPASALAALSTGTAKLAAAGLAPVHRKAVANAKRLSRRRTT